MDKSKKIIYFFVITFVTVSLLAIAINIYVNPYNYYGDFQLGDSGLTNARKIKFNYLKLIDEKPEIIVLGSSNSMRFIPQKLTTKFGMKAFNYGVFQATIEDYFCISKALFEQNVCQPKLILLCVDDWNFRATHETKKITIGTAGNRLIYKPLLSQYLPKFTKLKLFLMRIQTVIDWDQLQKSISELVKFNFTRTETLINKAFRTNGVRKYYYFNDVDVSTIAETGTYDIGAEIAKKEKYLSTFPTNKKNKGGHEYFNSFSKERLQMLDELFSYLEEKKCSVIVNIMPIQPNHQKKIEKETNYIQRIEQLKTTLNKYKDKHPNILLVIDNHKIEYFNGEANHFFDEIHPTSVNSDKMLERIFLNLPGDAF